MKINVLTVPLEMRETLERRFAGRAGMVEQADGFEWFELLRPVDGTDDYLVYTRWRSEKDFEAWQASNAFGAGHAGATGSRSAPHGSGAPAGHAGGAPGGAAPHRPAASGSTLWSFEVVQAASPAEPDSTPS